MVMTNNSIIENTLKNLFFYNFHLINFSKSINIINLKYLNLPKVYPNK